MTSDEIQNCLRPFLSAERLQKIDNVIAKRTFGLVPVLDGIFDQGNIHAVMRTAEALGLQRVVVIERLARFRLANRVSQGAEKWLQVDRFSTTEACMHRLKQEGYQIAVTTLEGGDDVTQIAWDRPTAVVFGNEKWGASAECLAAADRRIYYPMRGFVQSFNISVAAAFVLGQMAPQLRWPLNEKQKNDLRARFMAQSVDRSEQILNQVQKTRHPILDPSVLHHLGSSGSVVAEPPRNLQK